MRGKMVEKIKATLLFCRIYWLAAGESRYHRQAVAPSVHGWVFMHEGKTVGVCSTSVKVFELKINILV